MLLQLGDGLKVGLKLGLPGPQAVAVGLAPQRALPHMLQVLGKGGPEGKPAPEGVLVKAQKGLFELRGKPDAIPGAKPLGGIPGHAQDHVAR